MTDQATHATGHVYDGDMAAVINAAQMAVEPFEIDPEELQGVIVPSGGQLVIVDHEKALDRPRRKRGTASLDDPASFVAYVNKHGEADRGTSVYASLDGGSITALLNGAGEQAGWGDHRAVLQLKPTDDWKAWEDHDGVLMAQHDFAEFVEAHIASIREPSGADMLEIALTFEATMGASFREAVRLQNGQRQLRYEETVDARAGQNGTLEVPEWLNLALEPFEGSGAFEVKARLRYRVSGGTLKIGYTLNRADLVLRAAFDNVVGEIESGCEAADVYRGAPPR